jgi:hypothetical protein
MSANPQTLGNEPPLVHQHPELRHPTPTESRPLRDREPLVLGQEVDHLTRHLQVGHPPVEVDPVEALQIQTDVPIQDVVHGHERGSSSVPPGSGINATSPACTHPTAMSPSNPTTTSAVRGEASLDQGDLSKIIWYSPALVAERIAE